MNHEKNYSLAEKIPYCTRWTQVFQVGVGTSQVIANFRRLDTWLSSFK